MIEGDTDTALIRKVAAGASDARLAEAELCRRFAPRIRLYGIRHLGDEDRARDLVQTTLVGLVQAARAGRIREEDKVAHFVLGTCRLVASRMRELESRAEPTAPEALPEIAVAPPEPPLDREALVRCLNKLHERARQVVYLSFTEGRSAQDIGQALSTSPGNIRVLRHRAVMALRSCLEGREA